MNFLLVVMDRRTVLEDVYCNGVDVRLHKIDRCTGPVQLIDAPGPVTVTDYISRPVHVLYAQPQPNLNARGSGSWGT